MCALRGPGTDRTSELEHRCLRVAGRRALRAAFPEAGAVHLRSVGARMLEPPTAAKRVGFDGTETQKFELTIVPFVSSFENRSAVHENDYLASSLGRLARTA